MKRGNRPSLLWDRHANTRSGIPMRAEALSKSDWCDLFFDLYRQTHGEDTPDETIMADAEHRRHVALAPVIDEQRRSRDERRAASLGQWAP